MVRPRPRQPLPPCEVSTSPQQTQARLSSSSGLSPSPQQAQAWRPHPTSTSPPLHTPARSLSLQQTTAQHSPLAPALSALRVPSPDQCLAILQANRRRIPPARPNTGLQRDVFDPTSSPACFGSMQARLHAWFELLNGYPDPWFIHQLTGMIQFGCLLGYDGPLRNTSRHTPNLPTDQAGHEHLHREIAARLKEGRLSVVQPGQPLVESPIGVVPKPRSSKLWTIHHLSFPRRPAPNTAIHQRWH
ncbi:hypothetical protein NDA18_005446 [Ustilago nuda]|nr:hypothetical protein NDA18_005446 [Ustilago nuda]